MKQVIRSVGGPTRAVAERTAHPLRRAFSRAGYALVEELWLAGTRPTSSGERIAIVRGGDEGTLRLTFIHDDNGAPVPDVVIAPSRPWRQLIVAGVALVGLCLVAFLAWGAVLR